MDCQVSITLTSRYYCTIMCFWSDFNVIVVVMIMKRYFPLIFHNSNFIYYVKKKRNKTCELCHLWHWPNFMSFIVNDYLMFWCSLIKKFNLLFVFIGPQRKVNATVTVRSFKTEWIIVFFFISVCNVFYKKKTCLSIGKKTL